MAQAHAIAMPALSDTMSNGRLVKWLKKSGDQVKKGDVIAEVETDKAVMEVEAFRDGYLNGPLASEGTEAPVGQTIGFIADDRGETAAVPLAAAAVVAAAGGNGHGAAQAPASAAPVSAVLAASMPSSRPAGHHRAPETIVPASSPPSASARGPLDAGPPYRIARASSAREAVARAMIASMATPSFHVTARLPVEPLMTAARSRHYPLSVLFARACALTITAHPLFNAAYTPEGLAWRDRVDIGIAVDHGDGLITPVLRDAAKRPVADLAATWTTIRERAKNKRLAPADYSGATFYVSDLGVFSIVHAFDSIIPVGASAIISIAAPAPQDGHAANVTLTCDHRVVFGADAARFLETLGQFLGDPGPLFAAA